MGRYYYSKKEEADGLKKIQFWFLKKHGYFKGGYVSGTIKWTSGWTGAESSVGISTSIFEDEQYLRIWYTQTNSDGEKTDFDYKIPLATTPCHFGGKRYWFICPWYANGIYCGRRVGVLYLGGKYFACRHCYDLSYNSRNLGGWSKAAGQVISEPYLEELRLRVKRKYYAGKMTRNYRRFLIKERKSFFQLKTMVEGLEARRTN